MNVTGHMYTKVRKTNFKKARIGNDHFQLDITDAGITLHLLPDDPPGLPDLSLPHHQRHLGDDETEDIIIFKGQYPPQGDFNIFNWFPNGVVRDFSSP
jgi:hypothetical protein